MNYYTLTSDGLKVKDFDIKHTVESAQPLTFSADYSPEKGKLDYISGTELIRVGFSRNNKDSRIKFSSSIEIGRKDFIKRFRLNDDMDRIYSHISTDYFVTAAIKKYHGMRLTLTDPWESTLCFIISQYNNVKRIRLIVRRFISDFGEDILDEDNNVIGKGFPTSSELTAFTEKDFLRAGAGFRAKYIARASDYCTNNLDLYKLKNKSYERIKGELMEVSGVGDKVADCIALMGYGKLEAFPIDVWVKRTLENFYFKGREKKIKDLHKFAEDRWGAYKGYAQQYIFHRGRNL